MTRFAFFAAAAAFALPFAPASAEHEHRAEHIAAFQEQCMDTHDHEAFCACSIDAINAHLPPEYASMGDAGFEVSADLPEDVANVVDDAVIACRDEHIDLDAYHQQQLDEAAAAAEQES